MTTKSVKRPMYERLLSVPVETLSKSTFKIPRSNSHPGALKDLSKAQEISDFKSGFKKLLSSPRIKRLARRGYSKFSVYLKLLKTSYGILQFLRFDWLAVVVYELIYY